MTTFRKSLSALALAAAIAATSAGTAFADEQPHQRAGIAGLRAMAQIGAVLIENHGSVQQQGDGNAGAIVQNGQGNTADIRQYGHNNTANINQDGVNNAACIIQVGRGLDASVVQQGSNLNTGVLQTRRGTREIPALFCAPNARAAARTAAFGVLRVPRG